MRKVLLSEGSSLSARETITALGLAGQNVELLSSDPNCLGRYSRFVTAVHPAPPSGGDPSGYLAAMLRVIKDRRIDVLIPVHEQAYLFAAQRELIPADVGVALASFQSFEQVQSKERFAALLSQLKVPQPQTDMRPLTDLGARDQAFPFFVKTAFGTASEGVWRIENETQKRSLIATLTRQGTKEVVVQSEVGGELERAQTVFDRGRLVAFHTYRQLARGPGGGDVLKVGVTRPHAIAHIEKIGAALQWHGALAFDYLLEDGTDLPLFIDANPRLVEPMNALSSGVDLAGALLAVSLGTSPARQAAGKAGVVTRLGMMGLFDAAARRGRRTDVIREAMLLATASGRYRGTIEELTPLRTDRASAIPLIAVAFRLLVSPKSAARMTVDTVRNYSLTSETIGRLQELNATGADRPAAVAAPLPVPVPV
jgi:predicted ATP-grasp superfamily ATP-dependent carboligase